MRRTRHVVLPVRSWQYIGLLLVSLACVTFGLIARDREGQAGSLTGPELLHRAPHNVDVCPNLNPLTTSSICLGLPEKQYLTLKNNEGKEIGSDIIRVERKKSTESCINRNALLERRHRTLSEQRVSERFSYPTNRPSRSLERVDSRIENVRLSYRHSPNLEMTRDITDHIRQLSRKFSNDKFRSMERREQNGIKRTDGQRTLDNHELKERRERFEVDTRRKFDSRGIEKREIRNIDKTIGDNRKNVREKTQDNRSNSVERQVFRSENMERRFMKEQRSNDRRNSRIDTSDRQSNIDAKRRNSRVDTLNRERRLDVSAERRNSRLDTVNSQRGSSLSAERRNSRLDTVNSQRGSSLSVERRNSRLNTFKRERQSNIDAERRNSRADTLNRERRLDVSAERRNSRLDTVNSQRGSSLSVERRNSRLNTFKRERQSNIDAERRNSRADTLNRERQLDVRAERRNSRLDTVNSQRGSSLSAERRNSRLDTVNSQRGSSLSVERRNSRLDTFNRERQSNIDAERRNSRTDTLNRERRLDVRAERRNSRLDTDNNQRGSNLSVERRNSQFNTFNRERRLSEDVERKNSQHDTFNRERQSNAGVKYRNKRRDTSNRERRSSSMTDLTRTRNRYDRESIISNFLRIRKSTSHDNTPADRHDIRRKNSLSEIRNIRFNSLERQQSGNRLENQRSERRMIDLENRELLDRRSRSVDRQNTNTLDRNNRYLGLERRILIDRASEYIDRRDNRRELVNRFPRSSFSVRNSRGKIVQTKPNGSSESIDNYEQRNILLNHRIMEIQKPNRREINTLRRTVRSSNIEYLRNSPRIARYSSDRSFLDHTNRIERFSNERSNEKLTERRSTRGEIVAEISFAERRQTQYGQRRIARTLTPEISNRRSFIARKYHISRQRESFQALSRSFDNINRLNSNERRESVESKRFRTDNNRRSSVLSIDRKDTQRQRENLAQTSILLRTNLQERRRLNMMVQERYNRKIQRTISERRKSTESSLAGKVERSTELQSHDHQRNVRLNLIVTRHNDSLYREVNDDFDKGFKLIERSRSNANRRSSYRRLVDLRQFNSLRDKIRTSEMSTRDRNTLFVPMIDRDRFDLIRDGEKTRRLHDTNHRTQKISLEFRNDEYGKQTGMIANLLKTNVLLNYDLSFEIIRQPFIIIICILYGSSMSKNNKLFTDNLMQRIPKFALW
ncbi:serine/arginine repetitive matrix protein 2-like [Vespa mandarinia]|uniref:serine/arginine repetitive matrix protein 2-like n=1 Tax=Vespa mandarinia TaxID=7446 RepID=UPI001622ADD6|nr:serine/arginine repetitive matrix protein 2-like [Vespa mandarinia]